MVGFCSGIGFDGRQRFNIGALQIGFLIKKGGRNKDMTISFKKFVSIFWKYLIHFIKANLMFILFCLPVVTIPSAITGLYSICVDVVQGKTEGVFQTYKAATRKTFLKSIAVTSVFGMLFIAAATGIRFYRVFMEQNMLAIIPEGIALAVGLVTGAMIPYGYIMLAKTDLKLKDVLKNAFLLVFLEPKGTLLSFFISFFFAFVMLANFTGFYVIILLIGISIVAYAGTYFSLYGVQKHVVPKMTEVMNDNIG